VIKTNDFIVCTLNTAVKCIWLLNVNTESKAQYARFGVLTTVLLLDSGLLRCDAVLLGEWFPGIFSWDA